MSLARLKNRAEHLSRARQFFKDRNILEVDCGALVKKAPIDSNIDVMSVSISHNEQGFLHTSPEYAMKRLLSEGSGDIYYLGHVFRKGEIGRLHNPEFTMAEWYREGICFKKMIEETCEFLFLFLPPVPIRILSYREAFTQYAGINYTKDPLVAPDNGHHWSDLEKRHYTLSHKIEPYLGKGELTILTDYPPEEAALASVIEKNGEYVAERFEIYHEGIELANGYHELSDPNELRRRFTLENTARKLRGEEPYLIDEDFLKSLEQNFPNCCGVSVGFDRALMIHSKARTLSEVLSLPWIPSNHP